MKTAGGQFDGKTALVTGAASGIGEATARALAADGAHVVLFDLQGERAERVAGEIGGVAVAGDAASAAEAKHAVDMSIEQFGGLDVLMACAGADVGGGALGDVGEGDWATCLRANLDSCVVTVKAALPALIERRGSIVIVASIGAVSAGPGLAGYITAKSGLLALTRSLAIDYGPRGVRVNAVCPGMVDTPMLRTALGAFAGHIGASSEEVYARVAAPLPLRRVAEPGEIASVCLFLASDDASFVTGSSIVVDGGNMATNVGTVPFSLDP